MGFSRFRRKKSVFSGVTLIVSALSLILLGASFYFLHRWISPKPVEKAVAFNPQKLWRISDVSRVYKIRKNPFDSQEIWFCTAEGLHQFRTDEIQWTRYGLEAGLPAERVADLCFAGTVPWIGTLKGVAFFDPVSRSFSLYAPSAGEDVLSIEYLPGKGVYYYSSKKGLFAASDASAPPQPVVIPCANPIAPIVCLKTIKGKLYAGVSGGGIFVYDPEKDHWGSIPMDKKISQFNHFNDIMNVNGTLWTCTSEAGIYRQEPLDDSLRYLPSFPAKGAFSFAPEVDGFWCGTPWGLWRYYAQRNIWIQFVHPKEKAAGDFQIFSLCADQQYLWYGSRDLGTGFFNKTRVEWLPLRAGLSHPNVAAISAVDSTLWTGYGYRGGAVDRFDLRSLQYQRNYGEQGGIEDPNVQVLLQKNDIVYYGGFQGFGYKNLRTRQSRFWNTSSGFPFPDIADICPSNSGPWYLASCFGIVQYFPETDSLVPLVSTEMYRVTCLLPQGDSLWFGTLSKGLRVMDRKSGKVSGAVMDADRIMGIAPLEISNGKPVSLFVATKTQGCFRYDPDSGQAQPISRIWRILGKKPKNDSWDIMTVKMMNGLIWLGTRNAGCVIYDPQKDRAGTMDYYNGLISDQVRSFAESADFFWVGCYGGLNRIAKTYALENIQWQP